MFGIHYWEKALSQIAGRSTDKYLIRYGPRDLAYVCKDCAGKEVHIAHHRTNKPFYMVAKVWCLKRPKTEFDAVLLAAAFQCLATKLFSIVEMKGLRQTFRWP